MFFSLYSVSPDSNNTKIILALFGRNGIQMTDMENITDIPYKSLERYVKTLKDKGLVERKGSKKTGGFYLSEEIRDKLTNRK